MRYIVTSKEMKEYDSYTIEQIGIPSLLLMERAAMEMTAVLMRKVSPGSRVIVFAGTGNNGGDALAVGRLLAQKGAKVDFFMPGERTKTTLETRKQLKILENSGFSIHSNLENTEYDIVIDGLFGIGLKRNIEGVYLQAVTEINELKEAGAFVAAVDIPSGISADTGEVMGDAVNADITVSFGYAKAGHYLYPGRQYTGELFVRDIGLAKDALKHQTPSYFTFSDKEIGELLPERNPAGNKGTFGKVLVFAGSVNMCGAALLCAKSVLRAGAGMVKIIAPEQNRVIIQTALPEAMLFTYGKRIDTKALKEAADWADVLVCGPGIGRSEQAAYLLHKLFAWKDKFVVLDADALNLISERKELKEEVLQYEKGHIIMTPHPGEFVRLSRISMEEYLSDRREALKNLAEEYGCVIVGKDAVTMVAAADYGKMLYMNTTGNDGMATAGSGDVLAGIIGGLWAQGMAGFSAACTGVLIHGVAGDKAAERKGRYGTTASDIVEEL